MTPNDEDLVRALLAKALELIRDNQSLRDALVDSNRKANEADRLQREHATTKSMLKLAGDERDDRASLLNKITAISEDVLHLLRTGESTIRDSEKRKAATSTRVAFLSLIRKARDTEIPF